LATSLPFLISLHFWGAPDATRMLHTCKTPGDNFSSAKPTFKVPALSGALFPCNTESKTQRQTQGTTGPGAASAAKIRGEWEESPQHGTQLLGGSHRPNLLSGKRNVLHSLNFYFPSQGTSHSWRPKRKTTFLDIISVL